MPKKRAGIIIVPPGVFVSRPEKLAADFLAVKLGNDITFLEPSRKKGVKTPDMLMINLRWEIKSPTGKSSRTIENNIRQALRQSPYIILDLRHMDGRVPTKRLVDKVELQFRTVKPIRRVIVITRQETWVDFKR